MLNCIHFERRQKKRYKFISNKKYVVNTFEAFFIFMPLLPGKLRIELQLYLFPIVLLILRGR